MSEPVVLHDVGEAARLVRKSRSWLYQEGAKGTIPRTKIGRNVFWTAAQIEKIIRDGAQDPQPPTKKTLTEKTVKPLPKQGTTRRPSLPTASNIPKANLAARTRYPVDGAA